jgi:hypothetical protein
LEEWGERRDREGERRDRRGREGRDKIRELERKKWRERK